MTGFFSGFNLESTDALRLLAIAIENWRDGVKDLNTIQALRHLTKHQHSSIEMLSQRMARSPLLTEIINSFLETPRLGAREKFLAAGRDLRDYATAEAEFPEQLVYQDALRAWKDKVPTTLPPHIRAGHAERVRQVMEEAEMEAQRDLARRGGGPGTMGGIAESDAEITTEDEGNRPMAANKGKKKPSKSAVKSQKKEISQQKSGVSFLNRQSHIKDTNAAEVTSKEPSVDTCSDNNSTSSESEESNTEGKKKRAAHAPVRKPGEQVVDDGSIDKSPAVFAKKDDSKLVIELETIKEDEEHKGKYIHGKAVYDYLHIPGHTYPDWGNKDDIRALNKWRRQIFKRNFGNISKTRPLWLLSEKKLILDLATEQLNHKPKLKWKRLANKYNAIQEGVVQKAGEKFVSKGKKKEEALVEDRTAPWRTKGSMYAMAKNKWPEVSQLVRDAKLKHKKKAAEKKLSADDDESDPGTSGDDKEVPDPNPELKEAAKYKASGTIKSKVSTKSPSTPLPKQSLAKKETSTVSRKRKSESLKEDVAGVDFDASIWEVANDGDNGPAGFSASKKHRKQ